MAARVVGSDPVGGERRKSCDLCCSRKRRCDGDGINPCTLCATKGVTCAYSKKGRRGPKPKPKRGREGEGMFLFGGETERGRVGEGDIRSMLDWGGQQQQQQQQKEGAHPRLKMARMTDGDVVRLTPSHGTGTLGLEENRHLNAFFSGFGSCTQIVQEDEIRGAMIHVLSDGQFGMPSVDGESFYSPSTDSSSAGGTSTRRGIGVGEEPSLKLIRLEEGGLGIAAGTPAGAGGGESEKDLKQRAQRARLSAGVACLWAGIGVGAMLCGQTAEATSGYAENAREAIKGCYDVVSEEVLRAFLCLAHMHSFREDFTKFFRYTAMANDVAASLDRQQQGCSEPAKFLLKCFDAMSHFLELEGEESNSPIEGIIAPPLAHGASSSGGGSGSGSRRSGGTGAGSISDAAAAAAAAAADDEMGRTGGRARAGARIAEDNGSGGMGGGGGDDWRSRSEEKTAGGGGDGKDSPGAAAAAAGCKEKENEPRMLSQNELSTLKEKAILAGALRSNPSALAYEEFPGLKSAVRVQECISVLGDNPVAKHLGNFALSSAAAKEGQGRGAGGSGRGGEAKQQEGDGGGAIMPAGEGGAGSGSGSGGGSSFEAGGGGLKFPPLKTNQVLFVGDTRILEVSMGVDCSCISVMCKAVAGKPWAEIKEDARIVANTADAILVPVLASPSISRSVCAVKLLANSAFSHLCLGNAEYAMRAVRRFSAILKEFPGIVRFPPWRHCFHWMAGMLESAGLRDLYDGLRDGLATINMKSMRNLPEFGKGAHDIMCKCSHFRCQATHRALAEHAKLDPFGFFHIPHHCPQFGPAAEAAAASGGKSTTFRAVREASEWAAKLSTVDSRSSGGGGGGGRGGITSGAAAATAVAPPRRDTAASKASAAAAPAAAAAAAAAPAVVMPRLPPRPPSAAAAASAARLTAPPAVARPTCAARPARTAAPSMAAPRMPMPAAAAVVQAVSSLKGGGGGGGGGSGSGGMSQREMMFGGVGGAGGAAAVADRPMARTTSAATVAAAVAMKGARGGAAPRLVPLEEEQRWRTMPGVGGQSHPLGVGAALPSFDAFSGAGGEGVNLSAVPGGVPGLPPGINAAAAAATVASCFMGNHGGRGVGGGGGGAGVAPPPVRAVSCGAAWGGGGGGAAMSSGFVGGRAGAGAGAAGSGLATYGHSDQQLWDAVLGGGPNGNLEMNGAAGEQEDAPDFEEFAPEIDLMITDGTKAG
ncbi:hypothetical protein Esi_0010_0075 [Ectocarpus siliculosus]|uniref:Zn(2)-C6 fungal-type domain-containing protein n=1 Tax=Ectocarpus siliculosus TaxID=2880 RepID=D8LBZ1_ECTSI|nr:hypothetical protein Esi_0010_0075 [Ectocarpus siliculosus]|eukprot:CBN79174.1 hypothetical protein Esi_0010_0075 [Ectocarpus siliculosus]